jgi:hypothetical protein
MPVDAPSIPVAHRFVPVWPLDFSERYDNILMSRY